MANIDCLETWLESIERSLLGLSIAFETVRIVEELIEIWPNEVYNTKTLKSIARKRSKWKEVRRIFKILREIWLNIRVKKVDIHEGITVKVLLDSSTTGMFMDRKIAIKYRFKLQKLERPVVIRNINRKNNSNPSSKSKCILQKLYRKNKDRYVWSKKNKSDFGNVMTIGP